MMMRVISLLTLLVLISNPLLAEWRLGVKNHLDPRYNTRVLLDYTASTDRKKEVIVVDDDEKPIGLLDIQDLAAIRPK